MSLKMLMYSGGDSMLTTAVTCDECGELFGIKNYEVKKQGTSIVLTWFDCPHCGYRYLSHVTNNKVRRNQDRIKRIFEAMKYITSKRRMDRKYEEIEKLREENGKIMTKLKENTLQNN